MKILVLDNYDSFTFNLVHYLRELGYGNHLEVHRNDQIDLKEVDGFDTVLLSPGPGVPSDAGIMPELILTYGPTKKILGICLGHQAIAEAFGARIFNMEEVLHGTTGRIKVVKKDRLFQDLPETYEICHYHSWSVDPTNLGEVLEVTAVDELNQIMAISHKKYDVKGVQFHPESIMTEYGHQLLKNWMEG